MAALQASTGSAFLVGHSFGGLVALEAARGNKRFRKVAVYEPGVSIDGSIDMSWAPAAWAQLAQGQNLAAFITFARGVNPETTGEAPRWLLRLILPVAIRRGEREQKYRLLPAAIREHAEAARLDNTYPGYRDVAADVLLMAGKDAAATGAGRASQALLPVLPTATFMSFPALDHFGLEKKPKQIAEAVASFFLDDMRGSGARPVQQRSSDRLLPLGATDERTDLNRGESHAPIRSRTTVVKSSAASRSA